MPRIIAMTADVYGATAKGFDGRLAKPVQLKTLKQCLAETGMARQDHPPKLTTEDLIDHARLAELRATLTSDGESFLDRFGIPALREIEALGEQLERLDVAADREAAALLVHRIKNAAALLGASQLAEQAEAMDEMLRAAEGSEHDAPAMCHRLLGCIAPTLDLLKTAMGGGAS